MAAFISYGCKCPEDKDILLHILSIIWMIYSNLGWFSCITCACNHFKLMTKLRSAFTCQTLWGWTPPLFITHSWFLKAWLPHVQHPADFFIYSTEKMYFSQQTTQTAVQHTHTLSPVGQKKEISSDICLGSYCPRLICMEANNTLTFMPGTSSIASA